MPTPLSTLALDLARLELAAGVCESPPHSNRGERVDTYLYGEHGDGRHLLHYARAAVDEPSGPDGWMGAPWCARLIRWCFEHAAATLGLPRPFPRSWGDLASAMKWQREALEHNAWVADPAPGRVGVILYGDGRGHACLVESYQDGVVTSIDGNRGDAVRTERRRVHEFAGFVEVPEPIIAPAPPVQ